MANQSFLVTGGKNLSGTIEPQGAKNEALQILTAVLLTDQDVILRNIPGIVDVTLHIELLEGLGVVVERLGDSAYKMNAARVELAYLDSQEFLFKAKRIRGSVMLLGALLGRFGKAYLPKPGGDKIGRRRLDTHFNGFKNLGAEFRYLEEE